MAKRKIDFDAPIATNIRREIDKKIEATKIKDAAIVGELAAHAGVTRQAVSQYRNGVVKPNAEKLGLIAGYFGVSVDFMMGNTDIPAADINVRAICEYTGLSEKAVKMLNGAVRYKVERNARLLGAINLFLENPLSFDGIASYINTPELDLPIVQAYELPKTDGDELGPPVKRFMIGENEWSFLWLSIAKNSLDFYRKELTGGGKGNANP